MFAPTLNIDLSKLQEQEEDQAPKRPRAKGTKAPRPNAEEKKPRS